MANTDGQAYGLTVLSPIMSGPDQGLSHADKIRAVLAEFNSRPESPLTKVGTTHMARLAVVDDVYYQAAPAHPDHLRSKYLFFSTNFDGDLDDYLTQLLQQIPDEVDDVWKHCVDFPGASNAAACRNYFKRCQMTNAIFFADYPDSTVEEVLRGLQTQREFIEFVTENQGCPPTELRQAFDAFVNRLDAEPPPNPGSI